MSQSNSITGLHHASSRYLVEGKSEGFTARVLFLKTPNGEVRPFWRLFDYIKENSRKSPSWQNSLVRAFGLLWDYYIQAGHFHNAKTKHESHKSLIIGFIDALLTGTYRTDGTDHTGLYWKKAAFKTLKNYARQIDNFIEWSQKLGDYEASLNQEVFDIENTHNDLLLNLAVARKAGITLLGYLTDKSDVVRKNRFINEPDPFGNHISSPHYFPPMHYERLLFEGYRLPGHFDTQYGPIEKYNIRNMMIALLQGAGGCRESEPFHLYTFDVMEDPEKPGHANVLLYHPEASEIPAKNKAENKVKDFTRADFLKQYYSLLPRNSVHSGGYRAGWKNLKLNKNGYAEIFWIDPTAAALFWTLYTIYMIKIRGPIMVKRCMLGGRDHPFLFVSAKGNPNGKGLDRLPGAPYSISQYEKAHKTAVLKINLLYGEKYGTSTHGLRHLYGHLLAKMGVSLKTIQEGLHHRHFLSQGVYTVPDPSTINEEMEKAIKRIEKGDYRRILDKSYTQEWMKSHFNFDPERPII